MCDTDDLYDLKVTPEQIFECDSVIVNGEMTDEVNRNGDFSKSVKVPVPAKKKDELI